MIINKTAMKPAFLYAILEDVKSEYTKKTENKEIKEKGKKDFIRPFLMSSLGQYSREIKNIAKNVITINPFIKFPKIKMILKDMLI